MRVRTKGHVPETLEEIFQSPLLADVRPAKPKPPKSASSPVVLNFLEILEFYHAHRREPMEDDPVEASLARRLNVYRTTPKFAAAVKAYDDAGLLSLKPSEEPAEESPEVAPRPQVEEAPEAPEAPDAPEDAAEQDGGLQEEEEAPEAPEAPDALTLDDILNSDDPYGLLDGGNTSIFNLEHVASYKERSAAAMPDEIAKRRPCQDFWRYERFFKQASAILNSKAVMRQKPSETQIKPGALFVLRGQLCYVDSVLEGRDGMQGHGGDNRRLHVVFDNRTELDMLTLSLAKALYTDKHAKHVNMNPNLFSERVISVKAKGQPTGFIYVLETDSTAPELEKLRLRRQLVKIGYSTQPVNRRIANAEKEQTYLCAPVRKVAEIACYNLNPHTFERLVHAFLYKQKLNVKLINRHTGRVYEPKEWFTINAQTAVDICKHIVAGDIAKYRMNDVTCELIYK